MSGTGKVYLDLILISIHTVKDGKRPKINKMNIFGGSHGSGDLNVQLCLT